MKKMLFGAFLGMFAVAGIAVLPNYASADDDEDADRFQTSGSAPEKGGFESQDLSYGPDVYGHGKFQNDNLLKSIKKAINWVLGLLSFIALCLCLWGGFQMMTSGGDSKKYEEGLNILKWAAIGLAVIATSWLIVSLIFYVIGGSATTNNGTNDTING